jgi:hypothetical protein
MKKGSNRPDFNKAVACGQKASPSLAVIWSLAGLG